MLQGRVSYDAGWAVEATRNGMFEASVTVANRRCSFTRETNVEAFFDVVDTLRKDIICSLQRKQLDNMVNQFCNKKMMNILRRREDHCSLEGDGALYKLLQSKLIV